MPHEDDDSLASTVGSVTRDRGSAGAGGGGDDDSDDSSESSAGGGGFGRSPSNPVGSTPSGGGGGGSTGGDDDDDDDSSGRTPSGGPSPGAGGDPADDNPATGTDEPSGRTPGGGPSAGAGGDPSDDDPSFGGDPTDDPPAPGEPGGNEGIGDDGTDTGPTQAEQRQNQIDDAVTDFVSNNPFAQAAEDVVADIQDGAVQTQLSESARELQAQAQDIISNNPAADAIEDLNIDDGVSVRDQVQRSFERSQAIQERIAESRFADEASDVAASFQGSDVVTELTGEAAQAQQAVEETVTESRFADEASEVVADVQDGDVVTELTGEADDERALSETFADVDQDAQESNPLQEEIDFTPGVEGDPVERIARGTTEAFAEESAEAIDETSQQQIEALSELGLADRTDPQTFEQRFADDFFEDTTTAAAQTPQNLVEAPEQLLGLGRDVTLTTGVGADSREDIEAAQARNRQRGNRLVRAATGTVENVRQDPAELGGVLGQAGLAVATGTGTGRTLSRATGDRVGGSDVSGRILLEAGRQTDQAVRETLDRVGLRQSLREPGRGGGTFRDDSGSGSGDGDDEPVTISGEDIQPRQLGGPEVTQDLDSDRSDIDAANPVQRRREQAQRDDAGRETVTGRLGDERPTTGDPRAERSNIDFSNLGPFDSDLDTDTRTDADADADARSPEVSPDGDGDSLTPDVDSGGVFGVFDDAAAVGAGAAGASLVAEAEQRQEQAEAVLPGVDTRAATQPTFDVGDVDLGPDLDFETDTDTEGGVDITDRTDTDIDSRLDIDSRQDLDARQDIDVRQDTRQDLRQDTRQDTRQDVRQDVRQDIRQDLRQDLRVDEPDFPDDDDDDEPLFDGFEDETTGVRDVEATLEGVFDLPTGEEGGVFR